MSAILCAVLVVLSSFRSLGSRQCEQQGDETVSLLQVKTLVSTNRGQNIPHEQADLLAKLAHDGSMLRPSSIGRQIEHDNKTGVDIKDFSAQLKAVKKAFPGAEEMFKFSQEVKDEPGMMDVVPSFGGGSELEDEGNTRTVETLVKNVKTAAHGSGMKEKTAPTTGRIVVQLVFGIVYFFLVVSKYPSLDGRLPNDAAKDLQKMNAVDATCQSQLPNICLAMCCTGPRAAHTFDKTDVLAYWPSCILMVLFPCCTLFVMNAFTDLNEKLGGERQDACTAALCAFCCSCCLVAQDAESLDLIMDVETQCCGFIEKSTPEEVDEVVPDKEVASSRSSKSSKSDK